MIKKKSVIFFLSIFFSFGVFTPVRPISATNVLKWVKQKFASHPVTRSVAVPEEVDPVDIIPARSVVHSSRLITFENNIPQFFDTLKEDPAYAEVPAFIDQTIMVNGKAIMPGTSADINIEDGKGIVTIKLHKGFSKLIHAMQQGPLRGILIKLLKQIEPWVQWTYSARFTTNDDLDSIQLSDLVLAAYDQSLDQSAVNHRFKYTLVVDLSLNEPINL
jgi:hypothetical protein